MTEQGERQDRVVRPQLPGESTTPVGTIRPAFANPSIDAAHAFRAILEALSEPGKIVPMAAELVAPEPLQATAGAAILTLVDNETALFLDPALSTPDVLAWLRFHTGAAIVADLQSAAFAVIGEPCMFDAYERLAVGTSMFPDRSATVVLIVERLEQTAGIRLTGPGIQSETSIGTTPALPRLWQALRSNHAIYPLGFDCLLAAPGAIAGLPRSTRIELEGEV